MVTLNVIEENVPRGAFTNSSAYAPHHRQLIKRF